MFGFFDDNELHNDPEQKKRQKSALKLLVSSIDANDQSGIINDYQVSLSNCSCVDFIRRQKPCKHMYRLAYELGLFSLDGNVINATAKTEKENLLLEAKDLPDDEKMFLVNVLYNYLFKDKSPFVSQITEVPIGLKSKDFIITYRPDSNDVLARFVKKDTLNNIVKKNNCKIKLKSKLQILNDLKEFYVKIYEEYINDYVFSYPSEKSLLIPRKLYNSIVPPRENNFWI